MEKVAHKFLWTLKPPNKTVPGIYLSDNDSLSEGLPGSCKDESA